MRNMSFKILKWGLPFDRKFNYNDNWRFPEITIDNNTAFITDHLGRPNSLLDTSKYRWGDIKLPKGKSWNNDCFIHKKDKEYMFSHIRFYDAEPDLFIQFKTENGWGFQIMPIEILSQELQKYIREYLSQWSQFNRLSHIVFRFKQPAIYLTIKNYEQRTYYELAEIFSGLGRHFIDALMEIHVNSVRDLKAKPRFSFNFYLSL